MYLKYKNKNKIFIYHLAHQAKKNGTVQVNANYIAERYTKILITAALFGDMA
ncbi:hypothetical protein [Piscirickettsia salmonis]|uniref:hypothetical protein n=1 Tax=Piscirickettsia salmonis TaxID=1238 RepID=UPI0003024706|nr:hypothetical protein [Piscirickettsia salmonis]